MNKNSLRLGILVAAFAIPDVSFAAGKTLRDIAVTVTGYLSVAIGLTISLAVVTFIWNVYRYFFTEKDKKEAGLYVLYSTIGFFVILSLWGLVSLLTKSFNLENDPPQFPFGAGTIINNNNSQTSGTQTLPTGSAQQTLHTGSAQNPPPYVDPAE